MQLLTDLFTYYHKLDGSESDNYTRSSLQMGAFNILKLQQDALINVKIHIYINAKQSNATAATMCNELEYIYNFVIALTLPRHAPVCKVFMNKIVKKQ